MLERIRELGIRPPGRTSGSARIPNGHLQATGIDAAGRKQYRYHEAWRTRRDAEKFDDMMRFAKALPRLREQVEADLAASDQLTRERVLACAVRLLDRGFFRVGTEEYTRVLRPGDDPQGARAIEDGRMVFDYPAKSGKRRIQARRRPAGDRHRLHAQAPPRRRGRAAGLQGRPRLVRRALRRHQRLPEGRSPATTSRAKDFRTWSATVLAALALAVSGPAHGAKTSRKRAITRAIKETAHYLGNTPAVCRASYIDPRIFDAFRGGLVLDQQRHRRGARAEPGDAARPTTRRSSGRCWT